MRLAVLPAPAQRPTSLEDDLSIPSGLSAQRSGALFDAFDLRFVYDKVSGRLSVSATPLGPRFRSTCSTISFVTSLASSHTGT